MVTHAALAGAAAGVVLYAVALKVGDGAVVQFDGHVNHQGALGPLEGFDPLGQGAKVGGDAINLGEIDAPGAQVLGVQVGGQGMGSGRCGHAISSCE